MTIWNFATESPRLFGVLALMLLAAVLLLLMFLESLYMKYLAYKLELASFRAEKEKDK
jgi:hypothetical protein